mmetsp:Transcript_33435/g.100962  ORF Transcript_33435/g.100962 Transcript_33435/m.100962 type:complete len:318 (+) Transcript_33435:243-1196(+)
MDSRQSQDEAAPAANPQRVYGHGTTDAAVLVPLDSAGLQHLRWHWHHRHREHHHEGYLHDRLARDRDANVLRELHRRYRHLQHCRPPRVGQFLRCHRPPERSDCVFGCRGAPLLGHARCVFPRRRRCRLAPGNVLRLVDGSLFFLRRHVRHGPRLLVGPVRPEARGRDPRPAADRLVVRRCPRAADVHGAAGARVEGLLRRSCPPDGPCGLRGPLWRASDAAGLFAGCQDGVLVAPRRVAPCRLARPYAALVQHELVHVRGPLDGRVCEQLYDQHAGQSGIFQHVARWPPRVPRVRAARGVDKGGRNRLVGQGRGQI